MAFRGAGAELMHLPSRVPRLSHMWVVPHVVSLSSPGNSSDETAGALMPWAGKA